MGCVMIRCCVVFSLLLGGLVNLASVQAADALPVVYTDDFEKGMDNWQPLDPAQWNIKKTDDGQLLSQHQKKSGYKPPHRSPTNIALLKDVSVNEMDLTVKVRSTHPDYGHRDACVVFGY